MTNITFNELEINLPVFLKASKDFVLEIRSGNLDIDALDAGFKCLTLMYFTIEVSTQHEKIKLTSTYQYVCSKYEQLHFQLSFD